MEGFEELTMELTDWCPSRCLHCSSCSCSSSINHLDEKLIQKLIKETALLGAKKVSFGGGEPTASSSFLAAITYVTELGMSAEVFTCGLGGKSPCLISIPNEIIEKCKKLQNIKLIFSIYGANAAVHDYITQTQGSFKLLNESIQKCLNAGIQCEINYVPLKPNIFEFENIVKFAEYLNVNKLSVLRFVPQGRGRVNKNKLELSKDEEDYFIETLIRLRSEEKIDIRTGSPFNNIIPGNMVPCRAGVGKLVIQADGNVIPCEVFKHQDRCHWDLSVYTMSLSEILKSPKIKKLHDKLKKSDCLSCPVHKVLRAQQKTREDYEQVSRTTVHT